MATPSSNAQYRMPSPLVDYGDQTEMRMAHLSRELVWTKQELARQKRLKKMFINREKETKRQLERLQKYSNPETLSTANIATQVQDTIKQKKKKFLQNDYEKLQVAYIKAQEKFEMELQKEKQINAALQASCQEIKQRYETHILTIRQQVDHLQQELEKVEINQEMRPDVKPSNELQELVAYPQPKAVANPKIFVRDRACYLLRWEPPTKMTRDADK